MSTAVTHWSREAWTIVTTSYGTVLALLVTSYVVTANAGEVVAAQPAITGLVAGTAVFTLHLSQMPAWLVRTGALLAVLATLTVTVNAVSGRGAAESTAVVIASALLVVTPFTVLAHIVRSKRVTIETILAAICVYLLAGMLFTFIFASIERVGGEPFFAGEVDGTTADFLYFSFVTLTTVGYGDFTAAEELGRTIAVLEAILGQVVLLTLVARLVSLFRGRTAGDG